MKANSRRAALIGAMLGLATPAAADLVCTAALPVARTGERVEIRAWSEDAPTVRWEATGGEISGSGTTAVLQVPQQTGPLSVSGRTAHGVCSLTVFVVGQERGGRETGHGLLVRDHAEPGGYGLYSYILLGTDPSGESRERARSVIAAFLTLAPALADLESLLGRAPLNAALLPIEASPPADPTAEWLLEHYDFARARAILSGLEGTLRRGPYIVSTKAPATPGEPLARPLLIQDLSTVPPHLVSLWYTAFLNRAAQERFWEQDRLEALALETRTLIGVLAAGLPNVRSAVDDWVSWLK